MGKPAQPAVTEAGDVSKLLRAWGGGDQNALETLTPVVCDELRRLARHYMRRECPGHSLQTTALVNEAYMGLVDYKRMQWQNRAHFFAVSAQLMRRILVDHARRHNHKRGALSGGRTTDLVALDDALISSLGSIRAKRKSWKCGSSADSTWKILLALSRTDGWN
jgi:RNA polymerase sigma factor (TIGR02999 family)